MVGEGERKKYLKKYSIFYNYKPTYPRGSMNPKCKKDEENNTRPHHNQFSQANNKLKILKAARDKGDVTYTGKRLI